MLSQLPTELLRGIVVHVQLERDINTLARTCRRLHGILNCYLYRCNARRTGNSALIWAARNSQVTTARIALKEGAWPDQPEWRSCKTALALAAESGHTEMVGLLLARDDVDANSRSDRSLTPLALAAMNGRDEVVRILLASPKVKPNLLAKGGDSPISLVVEELCSSVSLYNAEAVKPYMLIASHFLAHPRFIFDPFCRRMMQLRDRHGAESVYDALCALGMDPFAGISGKKKNKKNS